MSRRPPTDPAADQCSALLAEQQRRFGADARVSWDGDTLVATQPGGSVVCLVPGPEDAWDGLLEALRPLAEGEARREQDAAGEAQRLGSLAEVTP